MGPWNEYGLLLLASASQRVIEGGYYVGRTTTLFFEPFVRLLHLLLLLIVFHAYLTKPITKTTTVKR